jgi:iron(III) transport system ATP-binding protein
VANFIGETNLISGTVIRTEDGFATVTTPAGELTGRITATDWSPQLGGAVQVSIRPEAWRLLPQAGDHSVTGHIDERSYLGQRIQYGVATAAGRQQVVELNPHLIHEPSAETISLHVRREDVVILKS